MSKCDRCNRSIKLYETSFKVEDDFGNRFAYCRECGESFKKEHNIKDGDSKTENIVPINLSKNIPNNSGNNLQKIVLILGIIFLVSGIITILMVTTKIIEPKEERKTFEQTINDKVVQDAVDQFQIVQQRGGSRAELCAYAKIVSAALVQAKRSDDYAKWKAQIEKKVCDF